MQFLPARSKIPNQEGIWRQQFWSRGVQSTCESAVNLAGTVCAALVLSPYFSYIRFQPLSGPFDTGRCEGVFVIGSRLQVLSNGSWSPMYYAISTDRSHHASQESWTGPIRPVNIVRTAGCRFLKNSGASRPFCEQFARIFHLATHHNQLWTSLPVNYGHHASQGVNDDRSVEIVQ